MGSSTTSLNDSDPDFTYNNMCSGGVSKVTINTDLFQTLQKCIELDDIFGVHLTRVPCNHLLAQFIIYLG
jgi:hypothetical protein